jgi:hypothetical protein
MERGIRAAVGPTLVFTMNLVSGIRRIISIIKGRERNRFTMRDITLYVILRGASPAGELTKRYIPNGKPMIEAKTAETNVI